MREIHRGDVMVDKWSVQSLAARFEARPLAEARILVSVNGDYWNTVVMWLPEW